ncbi:MAG: hypothetical protein HC893_09495 [Chloroflexaceae bacterium]|nr:hypothetical protein [Chloroflexaceae bacterium]
MSGKTWRGPLLCAPWFLCCSGEPRLMAALPECKPTAPFPRVLQSG